MDFNIQAVEFIKSAASEKDLIRNPMPQAAFAGRSNVGKSTVLNCLCRRKNLARVSATPGKTAHVNYFSLDKKAYLVDLPGYGFAKVSDDEKKRWGKLMDAYFADNGSLKLVVLLVDIRHIPTEDDKMMLDYARQTGYPYIVVANKVDKLNKSEIEPAIVRVGLTLDVPRDHIIVFSGAKGIGRDELLAQLHRAL
ncbi:MAG: YihA family ribosome biogenesis GTP-binding protein [Clostridia bacterium]|nr:YihA family ribosome biogenesis GTP-binding protein [Oscillospiraceae bacterium]MBR6748392.1 YihA family ribosome biogenesis GTP-binding protein [Clostridia bacterium]